MPSRSQQRIICIGCLVVAAGFATVGFAGCSSADRTREATLRQLGVVLKVYAQENRANLYPPKVSDAGRFVPDPDALEGILASTRDGKRLAARLAGTEGRPICYLGYLAVDENAGIEILNELAERDPDAKNNRAIYLESVSEYPAGMRFREGIERFLITDVNQPANPWPAGALCPIAWEIPDRVGERAALVLYLDGNVQWHAYPGDFPMSKAFIERLCELTGESAPQVAPDFVNAPLPPTAKMAMNGASHWWEHWDVVTCDTEPTLEVGGKKGYRVVFEILEKVLKGPVLYEPIPETDLAAVVPEKRRLLVGKRLTRPQIETVPIKQRVEFLLFPEAEGFGTTEITPADLPWTVPTEGITAAVQVDLGSALGYRWFGQMSFQRQQALRKKVTFTGGEDEYHLYVRTYHSNVENVWDHPALKEVRRLDRPERLNALEELKGHASDLNEYVAACLSQRDLERRPVPMAILEGRAVLREARDPLWAASRGLSREILAATFDDLANQMDDEAVALVALEALVPYSEPWVHVSDDLKSKADELLHGLPREQTLELVGRLARTLGDPAQAKACSELLEKL